MDNEQKKPIEPETLAPESVQPVPEVESESTIEEHTSPEHEEAEVFEQGGQVYQMPPHDDPEAEIQTHVEHIAPLPEEEKLWQLKLIARDKSLERAIEVIKKMDDPWLEDKFHDDLMDDPDWRAQLEALGKIERL